MSTGWLMGLGYVGVFLASVVAATPVPFTPELVLVPLLHLGYPAWAVFVVTLAGSYVGALISYAIGRGAGLAATRSQRSDRVLERGRALFRRWGSAALFFSWLPVVGDPIALLGGAFHVPLRTFSLWVLLGRGLRWAVVITAASMIVT